MDEGRCTHVDNQPALEGNEVIHARILAALDFSSSPPARGIRFPYRKAPSQILLAYELCSCDTVRPMETPKPASGEITVDASRFETSRLLFFDRYAVIPGERFVELHFAFYGRSRDPQRGLLVVVARKAIEEQKESYMQYLQQIGMPEPTTLPPCSLPDGAEVIPADVVGMARHGTALAEVSFHVFSWKVVVDKVRKADTKEPLSAFCAAILRCDVELQKRLILDLYEDSAGQNETS
jgi:hypothetical protein